MTGNSQNSASPVITVLFTELFTEFMTISVITVFFTELFTEFMIISVITVFLPSYLQSF